MRIDFVSDVICPWCFIAFERVDQAVRASGLSPDELEFELHPFQLDPSTPPEGADLRERLQAKYGVEPSTMFARVVAAAKEAGIDLDFDKIRRTPNTLKAHVLIAAAKEHGTQRAVGRALFEAYFLQGLDIGDDEVLLAIATKHGVEKDAALALLRDESVLAETQAAAREAAEQGVRGVPLVIFDQKLAVSGAQPLDVFAQAIARARS